MAGSTTATTEFDALDQLVSDSTSALTSYGYDGLGRLAVRNGTRLIYGGLEREPVTDGTSAYSRDPDGDIISAGLSSGNVATLTNTHGDLVAAFPTDGSSLTENRAYDPFGTPIVAGSANLRVGYQGSWTDPTTARVSAQARWYTPGTGSFASRDTADVPFTGAASANRYLYANANPLAYNDPTGYFSFGSVLSATASVARGDLGIAVVKAGAKAAAGAVVGAAATLTNPKRAFFGPVVYPIYQRLTKDDSPAARSDPVSSPVTTYAVQPEDDAPTQARTQAPVQAPVQAPATVPATRAADPTRTSVRAATTTAAGTIGRAGVGGGGPATKAAAQNIQGITATRLDLHSPGENLPQRKAQANSASGGPGLTVPDPNAGYHFVVPQCVAPQRCHDPSASAARPDAPA
ncbi:RHS repeat-associated core domain-containing protein, partial [Frankia sp. AiPs1]|uniref:RHS repeat-associated core domain-containing protein n=1 Tax=Frankia sp. AiPs1 TaxID=573493 RepID=UPI002043454E